MRDEKQFRKEFGESFTVGYFVKAGPSCPHAKHREGLLVLLEDAYDTPELLPPYDECRHDTCECEYTPVKANEVPKKTRVTVSTNAATQAKQKTRRASPVALQKKSGCASVLFALFLVAIIAAVVYV
jgi:hypothetical protein